MKPIFINKRKISNKNSPYIIAEISANHDGSINKAKKTIKAAKKIGADAVKIQSYTPDTMTLNCTKSDFLINEGLWKGNSLYELYSKAYTPFEWHKELFEYANKENITLFSSPFDETAVDLLESLNTPAYKIASFELVDLPLIGYVAKFKKPMIMSTGMANEQEISEAIETAKINGCDEIVLLHCISSYPAPIEQANINTMLKLKKVFNVQVGLSDHTLGNTASIVATSLGASVIEKHFTVNRSDGGPDSSFSLEPKEMCFFIKSCRESFNSLGKKRILKMPAEEKSIIFRRSLYFVKEIKKGEKIKRESVRRIRPGYGLSPKYLDDVIGCKAKYNLSPGQKVSWEYIEKN